MRQPLDHAFFADVFAVRAIEHANHGGYYQDEQRNLRCANDDEIVTPSPEWLRE